LIYKYNIGAGALDGVRAGAGANIYKNMKKVK